MSCEFCGGAINAATNQCVACGATQSAPASGGAPPAAHSYAAPAAAPVGPRKGMGFGEAVSTCFSKYADFSGRACRSEYWFFYLFTFLAGIALDVVGAIAGTPFLSVIGGLAWFLPSIAAMVRRLHDTNRSGWWYFICFTCIGIIPFLIWMCTEGDRGDNDYGSDPMVPTA